MDPHACGRGGQCGRCAAPRGGAPAPRPCGANERFRASKTGGGPYIATRPPLTGTFPRVRVLRSTSIEGGTVMHVQLPTRLRVHSALAAAMILAGFAMPWTAPVNAASHREAPFGAAQPPTH